MRIAMSVEHAYDSVTGTGVFVKELVKGLATIDQRNEYTLFTSKNYRDAPDLETQGNPNFRRKSLRLTHKMCQGLWRAVYWPPVNRSIGDHDIYHSVTPVTFPAVGGQYVVTVHDLSYMTRPALCERRNRHVREISRWQMLRRADHFIAVSEWTKKDMVEWMGVPPSRVTVIREGVRSCFRVLDRSVVAEVLSRYGLETPFFIVTGEINLRKNCERVVRVFARVLKESRMPVKLVFAGPLGFRSERTVHQVRALKLTDQVKFLGYLGDEDLVALVNGARALVFTSLYEGFGLPIVEAMACGTAVITSNVSSMPEVAGDAGLLVDPEDELQIAVAMREVLTDDATARQLAQRGLERAKEFNWERTAREHVKLYESLV